MIWELAQDHQPNQPDPLLQAVKQALAAPGATAIRHSGQDILVSFTGMPLGAYRVQWASNLTSGSWNTLLVTNISSSVAQVEVTDPGTASNQFVRFYRVQTPP